MDEERVRRAISMHQPGVSGGPHSNSITWLFPQKNLREHLVSSTNPQPPPKGCETELDDGGSEGFLPSTATVNARMASVSDCMSACREGDGLSLMQVATEAWSATPEVGGTNPRAAGTRDGQPKSKPAEGPNPGREQVQDTGQ